MFKTLQFYCKGCGFSPWLGNYDLTLVVMQPEFFFFKYQSLGKIYQETPAKGISI